MASTQDFVDYIIDQLDLPNITYRKMFGEYAIYIDKKVIGFICDNTLFVKILPDNEELGARLGKGPAYPGSKDYFIVDEDNLEDKPWLNEFIDITIEAVPEKKVKSKSVKKKK